MTILLALDPGKTTGVSAWFYTDTLALTPISHKQITGGLYGMLDYLYSEQNDIDLIVSESFILDGRTPKPDITPLHIEGMLKTYEYNTHIPVVFQPNTFKKHASNDVLTAAGLYWPGEQHAMDSARHAIAYLKSIRHKPTLEKYFHP